MCEYCKIHDDDSVVLKLAEISIGILGKVETSLELSKYEDEYSIGAYSDFKSVDESGCSSVKINYCPMCGRKLEK